MRPLSIISLSVLSIILLSALAFLTLAKADDGLCGIEPPKEGESCSGGADSTDDKGEEDKILRYEYEEKPMTEEEKEVWEKRLYAKRG